MKLRNETSGVSTAQTLSSPSPQPLIRESKLSPQLVSSFSSSSPSRELPARNAFCHLETGAFLASVLILMKEKGIYCRMGGPVALLTPQIKGYLSPFSPVGP